MEYGAAARTARRMVPSPPAVTMTDVPDRSASARSPADATQHVSRPRLSASASAAARVSGTRALWTSPMVRRSAIVSADQDRCSARAAVNARSISHLGYTPKSSTAAVVPTRATRRGASDANGSSLDAGDRYIVLITLT